MYSRILEQSLALGSMLSQTIIQVDKKCQNYTKLGVRLKYHLDLRTELLNVHFASCMGRTEGDDVICAKFSLQIKLTTILFK